MYDPKSSPNTQHPNNAFFLPSILRSPCSADSRFLGTPCRSPFNSSFIAVLPLSVSIIFNTMSGSRAFYNISKKYYFFQVFYAHILTIAYLIQCNRVITDILKFFNWSIDSNTVSIFQSYTPLPSKKTLTSKFLKQFSVNTPFKITEKSCFVKIKIQKSTWETHKKRWKKG